MSILNTDKKGHTISIMLNSPKEANPTIHEIMKFRGVSNILKLDNPIKVVYTDGMSAHNLLEDITREFCAERNIPFTELWTEMRPLTASGLIAEWQP